MDNMIEDNTIIPSFKILVIDRNINYPCVCMSEIEREEGRKNKNFTLWSGNMYSSYVNSNKNERASTVA